MTAPQGQAHGVMPPTQQFADHAAAEAAPAGKGGILNTGITPAEAALHVGVPAALAVGGAGVGVWQVIDSRSQSAAQLKFQEEQQEQMQKDRAEDREAAANQSKHQDDLQHGAMEDQIVIQHGIDEGTKIINNMKEHGFIGGNADSEKSDSQAGSVGGSSGSGSTVSVQSDGHSVSSDGSSHGVGSHAEIVMSSDLYHN